MKQLNMKINFIYFLLSILIVSCNNNDSIKYPDLSEVKEYDSNQNLISSYYTDTLGLIQKERIFYFKKTNGDSAKVFYEDGIKNGVFFTYYKNGIVKSKGIYKRDKINGWFYLYNSKGKIKEKQYIIDNENYKTYLYNSNEKLIEILGININNGRIYSHIHFNTNGKVNISQSNFIKVNQISKNEVNLSIIGVNNSECDSIYVSVCDGFSDNYKKHRTFSVKSYKNFKVSFSSKDLNKDNLLSIEVICKDYKTKNSIFIKEFYLQLDFDDIESQKPFYLNGLR
jgi:hypothetical protein